MNALLYCRGFLLTQLQPLVIPDGFSSRKLPNGMHFSNHDLLPTYFCGSNDDWLLLAGHAVNVITGESDGNILSSGLFSNVASGNEAAFFDAMDLISGRFIIVYCCGGTVKILHDACGVKSVYYSIAQFAVGSHASLVAEQDQTKQLHVKKKSKGIIFRHGYPGCETPYQDVYLLTPNTLLEYPSGRVVRYFPREDLQPLTVREAANQILAAMKTQVNALSKKNKILVSITAGIDSRLTLAAMKNWFQSAQFFTYSHQNAHGHQIDVAMSQDIAKVYGLNHFLIDVPSLERNQQTQSIEEINRSNCYYNHIRTLSIWYWKLFSNQNIIHLRSNLSEIGRAFYQKRNSMSKVENYIDMVRIYSKELDGNVDVCEAFRHFYDLTEFGKIKNYDPHDMLYWEHRMGCWHSQVVLESDIAFDTYILFNSRFILKSMLAVGLSDRKNASLFHEIIGRELPELSKFPINPTKWSPGSGYNWRCYLRMLGNRVENIWR